MENIYRKKLINVIVYFAKNVKHTNYTKMFKLLHFFDFEHFRQTGYPAIGLKYYAFRQGPVPKDLWIKIQNGELPEDFKPFVGVNIRIDDRNPDFREYQFKAKVNPDLSIFTPREIQILERLSCIFQECPARDISKASHEAEEPWSITKDKLGLNKYIEYSLAVNKEPSDTKEQSEESLKEYFEMVDNFNLNPI